MLLDFINGKNKSLTGEMVLELFNTNFRHSLDTSNISTKQISYLIDSRDKNNNRYGVCHVDSQDNTWIFFVDRDLKLIIANPHYLLNVCNEFLFLDGTGECIKVLGEYKVIDYFTAVDEVNTAYSIIDEKIFFEKKENICKEFEEFLSKKNRTKLAKDINVRITHGYEKCFVLDELPNPPEVLERLKKSLSDYDSANTVLSFILDKHSFMKESTLFCKKNIDEKKTDIFVYFSVLKMLSNNKHDTKLINSKKLLMIWRK